MEVVNYCSREEYCDDFRRNILRGLTAPQKYIESKYFYDARGSGLFEEICRLPEYYPTRTEISILRRAAPTIMKGFSAGDLVELGAGAGRKIRILLDSIEERVQTDLRYIPVDVSEKTLIEASRDLLLHYPGLRILGMVADFTRHLEEIPAEREKILLFLGGTVGNFREEERKRFFRQVARVLGRKGRFLLGLDLIKPRETLERAYDDSRGVTSDFNKNVLAVVNRRLQGNFRPADFRHLAFFNEEKKRIEMHLRARRRIEVEVKALNLRVSMAPGETIHTEISRKFDREEVYKMAFEAGLTVTRWFSDPREWFAIVEMRAENEEVCFS